MDKSRGFTANVGKYNVNKLVYFDCTTEATSAIAREKQIKGWTRQKKLDLIGELNPQWRDLSEDW
jgi:putative endonuclease